MNWLTNRLAEIHDPGSLIDAPVETEDGQPGRVAAGWLFDLTHLDVAEGYAWVRDEGFAYVEDEERAERRYAGLGIIPEGAFTEGAHWRYTAGLDVGGSKVLYLPEDDDPAPTVQVFVAEPRGPVARIVLSGNLPDDFGGTLTTVVPPAPDRRHCTADGLCGKKPEPCRGCVDCACATFRDNGKDVRGRLRRRNKHLSVRVSRCWCDHLSRSGP
jgi:hypothetical protein